jgi:hypothetical protein
LFEDTDLGLELGDAVFVLDFAFLGSQEEGAIIASLLPSLIEPRTIGAIRATKRRKWTKEIGKEWGRR